MLVLASKSPRRLELLAAAGIPCEAVAIDVDESVDRLEPPGDHVRRLAREKADAGLALRPDDVVLGADTIVLVGSEILGKPKDDRRCDTDAADPVGPRARGADGPRVGVEARTRPWSRWRAPRSGSTR